MFKILDTIRSYQRHKRKDREQFFDFSDGIDSIEENQFMNTPIERISIRTFFTLFICVLIFLGVYLLYLIIFEGGSNLHAARIQAQENSRVVSSRGNILTKNNIPVALSQDVFNVIARPTQFDDTQHIASVAREIADLYSGASYNALVRTLNAGYEDNLSKVIILENLSNQEIDMIKSPINEYDALFIERDRIRSYPFGEMFSHIIGYTADVNEQEVREQDYSLLDRVGRQGVEAKFDEHIRGIDGVFRKLRDSRGNIEGEFLIQEPEQGGDVVLTVDFALQKIIYEELKKTLEQEQGIDAGVVVALDPRNGAVRALVSMPAFDSNVMSRGFSSEQAQESYLATHSVFNRATQGEYPVGSVIKPLIAVGALEEGIISPNTQVITNGSINVRSVFNPNINWTFLDWKNHGTVDMRQAIAVSSNVYFYTIGGGYNNVQGLGINNIVTWLRTFHWGQELGIDFANETTGTVPTPEWKQRTKGQEWYIGDTYNTAIGQGDILITPLQIASALSAIVNGGSLYKPYIVDHIQQTDGAGIAYFPDPLVENIAQPESLQVVRQGMRQAVLEGSSRSLQSVPVQVAGKTGTAQIGNENNHALFAGFAPYEDPELVLVSVLEKGQQSSKAVFLTRDILQRYYAPET